LDEIVDFQQTGFEWIFKIWITEKIWMDHFVGSIDSKSLFLWLFVGYRCLSYVLLKKLDTVHARFVICFLIKGRSIVISFKKKQQITSRAEANATTHKQRKRTTNTTRHYTTTNLEKSQRSHHNLAPSSPTLCHG
jgi:hypothetical protein